jgi:hypothetical protein
MGGSDHHLILDAKLVQDRACLLADLGIALRAEDDEDIDGHGQRTKRARE